MSTILKVDHRESKLKELISSSELVPVYENLAHGDIQIIINDIPLFIFERKTIDDLIASIKDGRYKNQKAILLASGYTTSQIYYIIEGNVKWSTSPRQSIDKTVHGAIINTLLRDKIGIFMSKNIEETFELIQLIYKRVKEDPSKYKNEEQVEKQIITMSVVDKNTPEICFRNMLCQIPNISGKSADAIATRFCTMKSMLSELGKLSKEEQLKEISSIKVNGRKISSKIVEHVIQYLL